MRKGWACFRRTPIGPRRAACAVILAAIVSCPAAADPLGGFVDEVRVGAFQHDAGVFAHATERGADINGEVLFVSPVPMDWADRMPQWMRWVAQPRPQIGGLWNTSGATSQGYAGLTWTATVARGLVRDDDALVVELFGGGAVNNGYVTSTSSDRKSLGSNVLFRIGAGVGYRVTPHLSVLAVFGHESSAGLATPNPGMNQLGMQLGYRF